MAEQNSVVCKQGGGCVHAVACRPNRGRVRSAACVDAHAAGVWGCTGGTDGVREGAAVVALVTVHVRMRLREARVCAREGEGEGEGERHRHPCGSRP